MLHPDGILRAKRCWCCCMRVFSLPLGGDSYAASAAVPEERAQQLRRQDAVDKPCKTTTETDRYIQQ